MKLLRYEKDGYRRKLTLCGMKFSWKKGKDITNNIPFANKFFDEIGYSRSLKEGACVDKDGNPIPWYTYPSIEYLNQFDYSNKQVFEFGCGNSSLWWANHAKNVISVEEKKDWYETRLQFGKQNLKLLLKESEKDYCDSILKYENLFDVIIIDGDPNRFECTKNAIEKIAENGIIILDNSDRAAEFDEYKKSVELLKEKEFTQIDFYGFGPLNDYCWCTSVFLSKHFNFEIIKKSQPSKGICGIIET